jgi:hypothetical protein
MLQQFVRGVLGVVLATAMVIAQASMSVTGGSVLSSGQSVQITYSDPSRANGLVVIVIDDGEFPTPTYIEVPILLDARGKGTVSWVVPEWWFVHFNAPGVREVTCGVK